ncbi:serpentine type 7TM GPCR chemoreceptor srt domain-containing protein [Ditylenchus destructor]|nr:serpentine type 7TM GPCR chemoreceptor srt domain-containing protein [Ditylenchus destructor]
MDDLIFNRSVFNAHYNCGIFYAVFVFMGFLVRSTSARRVTNSCSLLSSLRWSIAAPIFGILGKVYCSNPILSYVHGAIGVSIWYFEAQISVVLAFNRCIIMYDTNCARQLFEGYKVLIYILG